MNTCRRVFTVSSLSSILPWRRYCIQFIHKFPSTRQNIIILNLVMNLICYKINVSNRIGTATNLKFRPKNQKHLITVLDSFHHHFFRAIKEKHKVWVCSYLHPQRRYPIMRKSSVSYPEEFIKHQTRITMIPSSNNMVSCAQMIFGIVTSWFKMI